MNERISSLRAQSRTARNYAGYLTGIALMDGIASLNMAERGVDAPVLFIPALVGCALGGLAVNRGLHAVDMSTQASMLEAQSLLPQQAPVSMEP